MVSANEPAFARVLRLSKSKGAARLVLLAIANHAHKDGAGAYPKIRTIARETNMSERWVQAQIPKLVALGELTAVNRGKTHETYQFTVTLEESDHEEHGEQPRNSHESKGEDLFTHRVHTASPYDEDPFTLRVKTSAPEPRNEPPVEPRKESASATGGLLEVPTGFREVVERIAALRGNARRGKYKRYRCNLTSEDVTRVVASCLETQRSDLVLEALEKFSWGDGFTSARDFVQRLALRKWIEKELPRLMDAVESLLARVDKPTQRALIRQARDGERDNLEYITSEELHDLHESLQAALA
jgi:hypothetical protein